MKVRRYASCLVSFVLGTVMILAALALMAFSVPAPSATVLVHRAPLQQSTITPTLTLTATMQTTSTIIITDTTTVTPTQVPTSTPMPTATPTGKDPYQARVPSGNWEFIDPNSSLWFEMTDSRQKLEVWLDANGQKGLTLEIFAPEQKDLWNSRAIGQGTFNKLQPQHDLFWAGKTVAFGAWHAKLTNHNSFPVNYSLSFDRVATRTADVCAVCHGYEIGFDGCSDKGDGFCAGLEDRFNH
jgi:hypothetical protein